MTETTLDIQGMTCDHCVSVVQQALREVPGVHSAEVSLQQKQAAVVYDSRSTSPSELAEAVQEAGFQASGLDSPESKSKVSGASQNQETVESPTTSGKNGSVGLQRIVLDVSGMHCASCTSRVEQAALRLPGVEKVFANLILEQVTIDYAPQQSGVAELESQLSAAGYPARFLRSSATSTLTKTTGKRALPTWRPATTHIPPNFADKRT